MSEINSLSPKRVWEIFAEICKYPRPSKKEEKIAAFIKEFGKKLNLEVLEDTIGNILIRKNAQGIKDNFKWICLQSHIDMVGEKDEGVNHDFEKDEILPYIDGKWVRAKGTTLGADNGIGIAYQLAILESKDIVHGPLECLFTVDEETGLTGAFELDPKLLKSKILINLDSEDEGEIFIGCAGGKDTKAEFNYKTQPLQQKSLTGLKIFVGGLKGGHSGDEINKGLGNSIKILGRILWHTSKKHDIQISQISGGNKRNAIPREASAIIALNFNQKNDLITNIKSIGKKVKKELKLTDPGFYIEIQEIERPDNVIDKETQEHLISTIYTCPHGVIRMTPDLPDLVETSTNLATLTMMEHEKIVVGTSQRSSVESMRDDIADQLAALFLLAGARIKHSDGYPGWEPDMSSQILKVAASTYQNLFNKAPKVLSVHAGLECGVIGEKYPGMDMISIGPTIKGAHSPDERIEIESVALFWDFLLEILKKNPDEV